MSSDASQKAAKIETALYRPHHRANSDRMLESTKDSPNPVFLDAPEQLGIDEYSFVRIKDENGDFKKDENGHEIRRDIRWYLGCKSIYVDMQPKDYVSKVKDRIFIKGALMEVVNTPQDALLFEFLAKHNDNVSNPDRIVPEGGEPITAFERINVQKDSSEIINAIEQQEMAFAALNRTKRGVAENREWLPELSRLQSIFGVSADSPDEAYTKLYNIAKGNPGEFLRKIDLVKQMTIMDFNAARKAGAIRFKDGAYFIGENDKPCFTSTATTSAKQDAEFIDFIGSHAGYPAYTEMRNTTEILLNKAK